MILGCTSDAGKSFLCAALCRYFANKGIRTAPFKAQNMSNNAAALAGGGEIGRAQFLQAQAARIIPDARMNPVLLKPSGDTKSQVILNGHFSPELTALPWLERKKHLWPEVKNSLTGLINEYELVIIEGAGSPAEINLREGDIVNLSVALFCNADVFLAADIDRGGAFAHLYGTWACFSENEKKLVRGVVLNKFRGDPALLGNAADWLNEKTGINACVIIPFVPHILPEEDAFFHATGHTHFPATGPAYSPSEKHIPEKKISIALILYPWASNLEEFDPLYHEKGVEITAIKENIRLDLFDAIILPGSKVTWKSLDFLRSSGLASSIVKVSRNGVLIHGVCGGMQMLGNYIDDPEGVESQNAKERVNGLSLLDITTELFPQKITGQRTIQYEGSAVSGYEIRAGRTMPGKNAVPVLPDGLGFQQGNVSGVYLHGLFDNTVYRRKFLSRCGLPGEKKDWPAMLDAELNKAAELIVSSGWSRLLP